MHRLRIKLSRETLDVAFGDQHLGALEPHADRNVLEPLDFCHWSRAPDARWLTRGLSKSICSYSRRPHKHSASRRPVAACDLLLSVELGAAPRQLFRTHL